MPRRSPSILLSLLAIAAAPGCSRTPSEPPAATTTDAAARGSSEDQFKPHPRDPKGNLIPRTPPPPVSDADIAPTGRREPDWDLDPKDPASDYVEQYIQSTERYGAETPCVHAQASKVVGDRTLVEARDGAGPGCKGTNAVRDTFAVQVDKDRLALADPSRGKPLGNWPDGSDPGGAPAPSPQEGDMTKWGSPIKQTMRDMQLVPLRLQKYGRGSYAVISIAGWHAALTRDAGEAKLVESAKKLCEASKGRPIGIFAGMDRQTILRVRCPDQPRWDKL